MNVEKVREDFPFLKKKTIYFDNACTTLKPKQVIDAVVDYYSNYSGCAGRSHHKISKKTEEEFEGARKKIGKFIDAKENEIIFTRNTTEGLNLLASSIKLEKDDRILTTNVEHHSVLLPFRRATKNIDYALCDDKGNISLSAIEEKMGLNTKIVVIHQTSNVFGTSPEIKEIIKLAHEYNALTIIDGAQGVPHQKTDVKKLGCDFLVFSGHKMLGPTGIGCLYGKYELLEKLPPFILGGGTVLEVKMDGSVQQKPPHKFEAGIQHYAGAIGLGAATDYLNKIGMNDIERHEERLTRSLLEKMKEIEKIKILGPDATGRKTALVSFNIKDMKAHHVALMLDEMDIAVRSGMFCAQPAVESTGEKDGAVRASLYFYNTEQEIDTFIEAMKKISKI